MSRAKASDQAGEFDQVPYAHDRTRLPEDHLRIRSDQIGPLRGNGTHGALVEREQQSSPRRIASLADAHELLSAVRMVRVRDLD